MEEKDSSYEKLEDKYVVVKVSEVSNGILF